MSIATVFHAPTKVGSLTLPTPSPKEVLVDDDSTLSSSSSSHYFARLRLKGFIFRQRKSVSHFTKKKSSKRLTNFWYLALGLFPLPVLFQSFRVRIMSFSPFISTTRRLSFYLFLAHTICPLSFSFYSPYYMAFNSLLP